MEGAELHLDMFDCPRHATLRITRSTCSNSFLKAEKLPKGSTDTLAKCRGCSIGARNSGRKVKETAAPAPSEAKMCVRCRNGAFKLVHGLHCISCYNREREHIRGRNARGTVPVRIGKLLRPFTALVFGKEVQKFTLKQAASGCELMLTAERQFSDAVIGYACPGFEFGVGD